MAATLRSLLSILTLLLMVSSSVSQQASELIVEELKVIPRERTGRWQIGDETFVVNAATQIQATAPAEVGMLAAVVFSERDGVKTAMLIAPQPIRAVDISDGPYVFWLDESTAEVVSIEKGEVHRTIHRDIVDAREIDGFDLPESNIVLDPTMPPAHTGRIEMPNRLLAISDLEGNYTNTLDFLRNAGVINRDGHWDWEDGHLVLIGDLVDRGFEVTELMWFLRRLEREAAAAGGRVHYILGNHEVMVMSGDLRYIHLKYQFVADRLGVSYDRLFSEATDIGRWWRSKNTVQQIGELLFVHAGYSPALERAQYEVDELNEMVREGLPPSIPEGIDVASNPIGHIDGPLWYRGYFPQHAAQWGGLATADEIQQTLDRHNASHIVIGHTLVEQVGPLNSTNQVIATDVDWKEQGKGQGLLFEDGRLWRLTSEAERQPLFDE